MRMVQLNEKYVAPFSDIVLRDPSWEELELENDALEKVMEKDSTLLFIFGEWEDEPSFMTPILKDVVSKANVTDFSSELLNATCLAMGFKEYEAVCFDYGPFTDSCFMAFGKN